MEDKKIIVKRSDLEDIHNQLILILHPVREEIMVASDVIRTLRRLIETSQVVEEEKKNGAEH